jgi:hypothetical protein
MKIGTSVNKPKVSSVLSFIYGSFNEATGGASKGKVLMG